MKKFKDRAKRIYLKDHFYFVTVKTFKNKYIFKEDRYAKIFMETLLFLDKRGDFELSAGVLLFNHFHLLLKPIKKNISQIMHDLKGYTTTKISEQIIFKSRINSRRGVEASALVGGINMINNK